MARVPLPALPAARGVLPLAKVETATFWGEKNESTLNLIQKRKAKSYNFRTQMGISSSEPVYPTEMCLEYFKSLRQQLSSNRRLLQSFSGPATSPNATAAF